ncbi:MAG: UDP-N-acetylglucosamine 1-carboxyvinyltransferase [Kiloniellales bacterium]
MHRIRIRGGIPLQGKIPISGAKNAALPLMAASLLTEDTLTLSNLPNLVDITMMIRLLRQHGVTVRQQVVPGGLFAGPGSAGPGFAGGFAEASGNDNGGRVIEFTAGEIVNTTAPYDLVRKMRASVLVLGPLLARRGRARVSLPGGCAIGTRPVDLHLKGLAELGAQIELKEGYINAEAPRGLTGAHIVFPRVSVGATENLMMAAVLARGTTALDNAAREPEVADLARCLNAMGARIDGVGGDKFTIHGVERLGAATHAIVPDRIETCTYAMAAAITGGAVELSGARLDQIEAVAEALGQAGVEVIETAAGLQVSRRDRGLTGVDVTTEPFPGFPTDLQAQMMALMATAEGAATITETIFENRFMHVPELRRMGAKIEVNRAKARVRGVPRLTGAPVMATDLRASVSLVLAGLAAQGDTVVSRVYHLDRGYERLEGKLAACGAEVERLPE